MKIVCTANSGQWIKATDAYEKLMAKAATGAIRDVAKKGLSKGRNAMTAAGFSDKFASSLVAKLPRRDSLTPSAYIHTTINWADVFERGATITGQPYLWLPLPNVPPSGDRPHMTPSQYARNVGPLFTIHRAGKPPMLASRKTTISTPFGRFSGKKALRQHGITSGRGTSQTVLLFVGVPAVKIPKKFDVDKAIKEAFEDMPKAYLEHLDKYEGR